MVTRVRRAGDARNARAVPTWVPTSDLAGAGNAFSVAQPLELVAQLGESASLLLAFPSRRSW